MIPARSVLLLLCSALFFAACEKEVNLNLNSGESKLVVEGQIETDGYPVVMLTRSIGYFSTIDLSTLENSFVHGAIVRVSDGVDTVILKEYALDTGLNGFNKFYLYTIDTTDPSAFNFRGMAEREYHLSIEHGGRLYESVTKIPTAYPLDSIWARPPDGTPAVPTAMLLFVRFRDPDTAGNYIRYFTKRNGEFFLPGLNSVYDDEIVNGLQIDSMFLSAGHNRAKEPNYDSLGYVFRGDTVTVRWCSIDKGVFDFFRTFEYATGTVGSPFASPVSVTSNIEGGALGVWAGYGSTYKTIIIPQ